LRLIAAEVVLERHSGRRLMLEVEMADRRHHDLQDPRWWTRPDAIDVFLGILLAEVNVPEIVLNLMDESSTEIVLDYAQAQLEEWEHLRISDIVPWLTTNADDDTMKA